MEENYLNVSNLKKLSINNHKTTIISYDELPHYDLFLSQVIDYLNHKLNTNEFTSNIIQNYIKNEVISKPEDGKKKGYTNTHLIQLILLSYMRPILTTDEIKKVFKLAFNEINNFADDIITWELAYKLFTQFQMESLNDFTRSEYVDEVKLGIIFEENHISEDERERIKIFLTVMTLIAKASTVKKLIQNIVDNNVVE
jgi:hypothetical protein